MFPPPSGKLSLLGAPPACGTTPHPHLRFSSHPCAHWYLGVGLDDQCHCDNGVSCFSWSDLCWEEAGGFLKCRIQPTRSVSTISRIYVDKQTIKKVSSGGAIWNSRHTTEGGSLKNMGAQREVLRPQECRTEIHSHFTGSFSKAIILLFFPCLLVFLSILAEETLKTLKSAVCQLRSPCAVVCPGRREALSGNNSSWQWKGRKAGRPILRPLQDRKGLYGTTRQPGVVLGRMTLVPEGPVYKSQPHAISWPNSSTFWTKCTTKWKLKNKQTKKLSIMGALESFQMRHVSSRIKNQLLSLIGFGWDHYLGTIRNKSQGPQESLGPPSWYVRTCEITSAPIYWHSRLYDEATVG